MVAPAATLAAGLRQVNPGAAEAFDAFGFLHLPGRIPTATTNASPGWSMSAPNRRGRTRDPRSPASSGLPATSSSWTGAANPAMAPPRAAPAAAAVVFRPALMVNTWARAASGARSSRTVNSAPVNGPRNSPDTANRAAVAGSDEVTAAATPRGADPGRAT